MLNDCRCLFIVNKSTCFNDKFFRIILKLVKDKPFNSSKNLDNCFSCKTSSIHEFTNQVVLNTSIDCNFVAHTIRCRCFLHEGCTRSQSFLRCDSIHTTSLNLEVNLGNTEFLIQRCNGLSYKFITVKVNNINGLGIDTIPKCLELRHCQFILLNLELNIVAAGIFRLHCLTVIDGINDAKNGLGRTCHFINEFYFTVCLVFIILVGKRTLLVNVTFHTETKPNFSCDILSDNIGVALCICDGLAHKQFRCNCFRATCNCICQFRLQALCKTVITFACNNGKYINIVNIIAQNIDIHSLPILINTETQPTTNFLSLANITTALLQGTNLEHIRIVPTFTKC